MGLIFEWKNLLYNFNGIYLKGILEFILISDVKLD